MTPPPGVATVPPYLVVDQADAYGEFLVAGLGGTLIGASRRPDGAVANAQVSAATQP